MSHLLLFAEEVCVSKPADSFRSAQSQVYEGFSIKSNELCVVKQVKLDVNGLSCLIKELQVQMMIREKKKLARLNQQNLFVHGRSQNIRKVPTLIGKNYLKILIKGVQISKKYPLKFQWKTQSQKQKISGRASNTYLA